MKSYTPYVVQTYRAILIRIATAFAKRIPEHMQYYAKQFTKVLDYMAETFEDRQFEFVEKFDLAVEREFDISAFQAFVTAEHEAHPWFNCNPKLWNGEIEAKIECIHACSRFELQVFRIKEEATLPECVSFLRAQGAIQVGVLGLGLAYAQIYKKKIQEPYRHYRLPRIFSVDEFALVHDDGRTYQVAPYMFQWCREWTYREFVTTIEFDYGYPQQRDYLFCFLPVI